MDSKEKQKLSKKRRFIIKRLQQLDILPVDKNDMTPVQQNIYDSIWSYDFTYWEEVKKENGWVERDKLTEDEKYYKEKKKRIRNYLRENGVLPAYGEPLTEEQEKILSDIDNNDFRYFEKFKRERLKLLRSEISKKIPENF